MMQHHTHPLVLKNRSYTQNKTIINEIKDFLQMKLSVANIVNVLNHKYDANLQYADVYHITENLKNGGDA